MKGLLRWLPLVLAVLVVPACGGPKKAAEQAVAAAEAAYGQIGAQADNLAPDQAKEIETGLAGARASLEKGDFKAALEAAQQLRARIQTLSEGMPALLTKLQDDWKALTTSVPGALTALDRKLKGFGRPPAGMPGRDSFDAAVAELGQLNQQWDAARALAANGRLAQAVTTGEQVKDDAVRTLAGFQTGS
jgi:hypothetical protein